MRDKDIKILWGRSGNRCAICKLELTPDGSRETLGEMAHIIARSVEGPRGSGAALASELDAYDNLILLCPTHHVEVDKDTNAWPAARLRATKTDHERWVSEQLGAGGISVAPIDNTIFLNQRETSLVEASRGHVAMVLSLTPLRVSGDALDPLNDKVVEVLEQARLPKDFRQGEQVNRYRTRPTEYGVANEDFPETANSEGHSIQIFRTGHCEYFWELGAGVDHVTGYAKEQGTALRGATRVLRYTDIAAVAEHGLTWMQMAWGKLLPFNYMTFCGAVINTNLTIMYSREGDWRRNVLGYVVRSPILKYTEVIPRTFNKHALLLDFLSRIVNSYGLVLPRVLDDTGDYFRPVKMR